MTLYKDLKAKQRQIRSTFPDSLGLRVHRALSWLDRSEQCKDDQDAQFIFLWIAFNAAYAQDTEFLNHTESKTFSKFIEKLLELDKEHSFYNLIWTEFSTSIRLLLDNKFVFQPFWDFHNGKSTQQEWESKFSKAKIAVNKALSSKETHVIFSIILQRLYTLRNQLVHGGATWNGKANRTQIRDATAFLSKLVPIVIDVMMNNPNALWGSANYPVVKE